MKTFKTYEQWLVDNPEYKGKQIKCDECNGTGRCCQCYCGTVHDCGYCDGEGKIDLGREEYQAQLEADKRKLERLGLLEKSSRRE